MLGSPRCCGEGEACTAAHGAGGMLPFAQTHQANSSLVLGIIDCLVQEVWFMKLRILALSFVLETECDTRNATSLYCGLFVFHSPAIIQVACCSCPSLWNGLCFQPLVICENRLECFIFRIYFGCYSCRIVFSRSYIQLWKHWVTFKELFTNVYKSEP